jgi:cytochrome c5
MHRLLKLFLIVLGAYVLLKLPGLFFNIPVPSSLVLLYLFFVALVTLLVMTSTEASARALFAPIVAIIVEPSMVRRRNAIFAVLPVLAALITYIVVMPDNEASIGFRAVHPAPPAVIEAYGKSFDLAILENPLRSVESTDPARFARLVKEGGEIYYSNCLFCHGAKLDGRGHYAHALNPRPLTFQGVDTIAQLQESYVFWRIVKGGPGLPKQSGPWASSMPVWEGELGEEEVWKVILFLYDYTGNRPREWSR